MLSISALDMSGAPFSPATRMPVLKPSLGYSEHDTRLRQGESSFIPRYWWCCSGPPHRIPIIMNWNMIISGFIIAVIKVAGMTIFLLYCEYLCEPSPQRPYCQNVRLSIKVQCPCTSTVSFLTLSDTGVRFTALQQRCTADCIKGWSPYMKLLENMN